MIDDSTDILIIGGGLTGASLLLALQKSPWKCRMIDARLLATEPETALDARSLALAPASMRILRQLGLESAVLSESSSIDQIHVSQQGHLGISCLKAKSEPLGQVIELNALNRIIVSVLNSNALIAPARFVSLDSANRCAVIDSEQGPMRIRYQLLVAADGADSAIRKALGISASSMDYKQQAIVCNIRLSRSHQQIAYERFTTEGPLAMLPLQGERAALVWAMAPDRAKAAMALSEPAFIKALQHSFGYRLGRFMEVGERHCIPLFRVMSKDCVTDNTVLIGSAAQHLHPVAGQGFNLALRDVATLTQCIVEQGLGEDMLRRYATLRRSDRLAISRFTDGLVRVFSQSLPGLAALRAMGLLAFDSLPPLQDLLAHYARGFAGTPPDMACGIPLQGVSHA